MMTTSPAEARRKTKSGFYYGYLATILVLALTGFGQMPIYKRYYLTDVPGFGWLADFWATRYVHYIGAAVLLGLGAYFVSDYLLNGRGKRKLTISGGVRAGLLAGIAATGILFVVKNFPGVLLHPALITALDLAHIGLVMLFLLSGLYCLVFRKPWTIST